MLSIKKVGTFFNCHLTRFISGYFLIRDIDRDFKVETQLHNFIPRSKYPEFELVEIQERSKIRSEQLYQRIIQL